MTPRELDEQQRRAEGYRALMALPQPEGDSYPRCHFVTCQGDPERFKRWSYLPTAYAALKSEQMRPVSL